MLSKLLSAMNSQLSFIALMVIFGFYAVFVG